MPTEPTVAERIAASLQEFADDLEAGVGINDKYRVRRLVCECWRADGTPCPVHGGEHAEPDR